MNMNAMHTHRHKFILQVVVVVSNSNLGQAASRRVLGIVDSSLISEPNLVQRKQCTGRPADRSVQRYRTKQTLHGSSKRKINNMENERTVDPLLCPSRVSRVVASQTMLWSTYPLHTKDNTTCGRSTCTTVWQCTHSVTGTASLPDRKSRNSIPLKPLNKPQAYQVV